MKQSLKYKKFFLILLSALTGCSTYKESFDCPVGSGIQCRSISHVDQMVEQGTLPSSQNLAGQGPGGGGVPASSFPNAQRPCCTPGVFPSYKYHTVVRIPEQHLRIWIAGFHDGQGNFHDENVIYTVLRPGQWVKKG